MFTLGAPSAASTTSSLTWSTATGVIAAGNDMTVTGGNLVNAGTLYAQHNVTVTGATVTNQGGDTQQNSTQAGCVAGTSNAACIHDGYVRGENPTTSTFTYLQDNASIIAGNDLTISAGTIDNTYGNLIAGHDIVVTGVSTSAGSTTAAQSLTNTSGNILAGNDITFNVSGAVTNTLPPPVPVHQNYGSVEQYSGCMTAGGYKESYCEGYVDQQSGDSSVISAGHNLNIDAGTLTNVGSLITAGVNATINVAGPVVNQAQTLNAYWHSHWVQETGDFSPDKRHDIWACGSVAECTALYGDAYTRVGGTIDPPQPVGNIAATIEAPNLSISSGGQIENVGNVLGTSVALTGQRLINGITTSNTYTPRVNAPSQVISLSPATLPGLNISLPRTVGTGSVPTAVAGQASFVDASLGGTSQTSFSPQLLLSNLPSNLQPSSTLFYYNPQEEDLLLQQAALQQTGKATFVDGLSYDSKNNLSVTEQEKAYLYGNAIDYAKANNVQLGQALTQAQVTALDRPMLWYVEQTVPDPSCSAVGKDQCPTITALMPQVYLPSTTTALSAGGNIQGTDVTLNFNKDGQGSVLNTGVITASGTLTVNAPTLTNEANQVDVGQIWSKVKGGYLDTTGTQVQPGGFMSAANMDLNVQTLSQIGGALQKLNADGTVDQAGTQELLAQLSQQLGGNFTQQTLTDHLHSDFVAEGGFGVEQVFEMAMAVALSIVTAGVGAALVGAAAGTLEAAVANAAFSALVSSLATDVMSGNFSLTGIAESVGVAVLTAGITNGISFDSTTNSLGFAGWTDKLNDLGQGVKTLGQMAGSVPLVGTAVAQSTGPTLTNLMQQSLAIGAQATLQAGVQTAIEGGSFLNNFEHDAVTSIAATGANDIGTLAQEQGSIIAQGSIGYDLAHAALGCASSAALGTGCAGGAIGGATSALVAPYLVQQAGGLGNLTDGQRAAIVGISTLLGGVTAGLAGQNALGAANAATNEALNNSTNPEDIAHGKDLIPLEGGVGGGTGIGGPGGGEEIFPDAPPESAGGSGSADAGAAPVTTTPTTPATSTTSQGSIDPGTGANDWNDASTGSGTPNAPVYNPQGATRAAANSGNWSSGSLSDTVQNIVGSNPDVTYTTSGKTIYTNPTTGMAVVYDNAGNYYRVQNGAGQYLDQSGNAIPNNVPLIGPNKTTQTGVPSGVRNGLTHFNNTDPVQ